MQVFNESMRQTLECVWTFSGQGGACHWIERQTADVQMTTPISAPAISQRSDNAGEPGGEVARKVA